MELRVEIESLANGKEYPLFANYKIEMTKINSKQRIHQKPGILLCTLSPGYVESCKIILMLSRSRMDSNVKIQKLFLNSNAESNLRRAKIRNCHHYNHYRK